MYKLLSLVLGIFLVLLGIHYVATRWSADKKERELQNKVAELEGMVKETETAYSARAIELENLKLQNKELEGIIEDRDEKVAVLGELVLQWKTKYFKIKDAKETPVGGDGTTVVEIPASCQTCLEGVRFRVEFEQVQDFLRVQGFTLTNPAYAELGVRWERELKLSFILTKKDDKFRLYFDSDTPDLVPGELTLTVDPSVFEKKWYEKIAFGGKLNVGEGVVTSVSVGYEVREGLVVSPSMSMFYNGERGLLKLYGADVLWFPFR